MTDKKTSAEKEARQRFGRDIGTRREAKGVSLKTVSRDTCVHLDTLRELEITGLYGHPVLNSVYVRCLVGAYAKAVGLPKDEVITALDAAFEGTYAGTLVDSSEVGAADSLSEEQAGQPA